MSSSDSSSEPDVYVQDGFVVADEPLDDEVSSDEVLPKKRRIRLKRNDQEDLDLLKENLGLTMPHDPIKKRPKLSRSSSEDSLEPGEIPVVYNENVQLAASIFGTNSLTSAKEERRLDFEPAEQKEKFITSEDEMICDYDVPERLQLVFKNRESPDENEIVSEVEWFLARILQRKPVQSVVGLQMKLHKFLIMYRIEKYEIPFIARYRMGILKPELDCDLWELYSWDKEWGFLYSTKQGMINLYEDCEINRKSLSVGKVLASGSKVLTAPCAEVEKELKIYPIKYIYHLNDLEAFFKVHCYSYNPGKHTVKSYSQLQEARSNGILLFTSKAALTPVQFSENLIQSALINIPNTNTVKPQDLAFELLSNVYTEELQVMNAACNLMKSELISLPSIRSYIRNLYFKHARVCTTPTEKGRTVLDVFHPYYRVKNLAEGKYIHTWTPEMWAEVLKCEELGFIQVEFKLPWDNDRELKEDRILESIKPLYLTEAEDDIESDWNHFRLQVLKQTLSQLYEEIVEAVRKDLNFNAEEWVKSQVQAGFFQIIDVGKVKKDNGRVMALCTDPDTQMYGNSYMALVNGFGEVSEVATFNTLTIRRGEGIHDSDKARSTKEKSSLGQILLRNQPDAIVIAANSLQAVTLRRNLMQLIESLQIDTYNENEFDFKADPTELLRTIIPVFMCDPQVPKLFASSQQAKRLFPEYKILIRMAISLARYVQNACAETLFLAADPNEMQIKYLNLHPLQSLLSEAAFLSAIDIVALDYIASSGVIINEVIQREHLSILLSYLPGLGHSKSHRLIENLKQRCHARLSMRAELIGKRLLGNRVYDNAAGFIKILFEERESDPLDSTRIHPESYDLAKVIARSVFSDSHIRDDNLIQEVMSRPQKMQDLDLEKYAELHLAKTGVNIKETLENIVAELTSPYLVPEKRFADLGAEGLLYLCSGESKYSLRRGSIVQACVVLFDESKQVVRTRLECGLEAFVETKQIPERKNPEQEQFTKGQVITARVIDINVKTQGKDVFFKVKLSLLPDDIINHGKFIQLTLDDAFVMEDADWIEKAIMEDEYKTGQKYVPRVVNHPKFKNIGLRTACEELLNKDIGDCLFRPSSRGQDHLTCTWKFYDFIYSHLDIIEEGKPAQNMLGTKFRISTEVYESLQEIVDRYVGPCEKLTKESITHPKFKDSISGGVKLIENLLISEKRARPSSIPYYFTIQPEYPQYLVLYYMPKEEVTTEYIKIKPKGFFFHEAYHPNIHFLISWFKRHYSDRTYKSQLARSVAPVIDTSNHLSIPGRLPEESKPAADINDENKPVVMKNMPESTPYNRTPHIGIQEWSGGKEISKTPRADDWEMSRNFDSWGNKTPVAGTEERTEENKVESSGWGETATWGGDSSWKSVPAVPETNWGEEPKEQRGRGERGSRGGRGCRKCGEEGHMARECTNAPTEKRDNNCFKCGQSGHMSRECTNPPTEKRDNNCFKCGQSGHMSRECTNAPTEKRDNNCFKCGESGHMSRDCTNPPVDRPKSCFNCGQSGHMSRECPNPPDESRPRRSRGERGRGRGRGRGNDEGGGGSSWAGESNAGWGGNNDSGGGWGGSGGGNTESGGGWGGSGGGNTESGGGWGGSGGGNTDSGGWGSSGGGNTDSGGGWGTTNAGNSGGGNAESGGWSSGGGGSGNTSGGWGSSTEGGAGNTASGGWGGSSAGGNTESGGWGGSSSGGGAGNTPGGWGGSSGAGSNKTGAGNTESSGWGGSSAVEVKKELSGWGESSNSAGGGWGAKSSGGDVKVKVENSGWGTGEEIKVPEVKKDSWGESKDNKGSWGGDGGTGFGSGW